MHENANQLRRLYDGLKRRDHGAMAACYTSDATFEDIAFRLKGQDRIHAMWRMICEPDVNIEAEYEVLAADDRSGRVALVDTYTFTTTGNRVVNRIESRFDFHEGRISRHHDVCDPRRWADQAFGPVFGFLPGRLRLIRRAMAHGKLWLFRRREARAVAQAT